MVGATDNRSSTDSRGGSERSTRNTLVRNASSASLTRAGGSRAEPTRLRFATRNPNQSGIRIDPDRGRVTVTTITLLGFEVADRDEATRGPVRRQQPEVSSLLSRVFGAGDAARFASRGNFRLETFGLRPKVQHFSSVTT